MIELGLINAAAAAGELHLLLLGWYEIINGLAFVKTLLHLNEFLDAVNQQLNELALQTQTAHLTLSVCHSVSLSLFVSLFVCLSVCLPVSLSFIYLCPSVMHSAVLARLQLHDRGSRRVGSTWVTTQIWRHKLVIKCRLVCISFAFDIS